MSVEIICQGPPAHPSEILVTNYLRHNLSSGSAVLGNYYLPDRTDTLEIDHVVINRNGVYLLEVKHWRWIEADQVHWRNEYGDVIKSPIISIEHKARVMYGFLNHRGWGRVSVVGLVVLSRTPDKFICTDPNVHKVFELNGALKEALTGREYVFGDKPSLRNDEVKLLRKVILDNRIADENRRVVGYRVLNQRDRGYYIDIEAEDPQFRGHKVRIKQYDLPEVSSVLEIKKAIRRFRRDMVALTEAGAHPNLLMPHRFHCDTSYDERFYLIMEWPWGQTLAERITTAPISLAEQLHILKATVAALARCHERGIIHRNLSPYAIYLTNDGRVKMGDFDFAKMPAVTRSLSLTGVFPVAGRHVSPEVAFNAYDVDTCADIYSLGVVWYDMLFRPTEDEHLDRGRVAFASLPERGRNLLRSMLAEKSNERPTLIEVEDCLDVLSSDLH